MQTPSSPVNLACAEAMKAAISSWRHLDEFDLAFGALQRTEDAVDAVAGIAVDAPDAPLMKTFDEEIADGLWPLQYPRAARAAAIEETKQTVISVNPAKPERFRPVAKQFCQMSKKIEDYALIGDRRSAALVARDGSIDWLCWPRFDSDACFAALLGDERHGYWRLAPRGAVLRSERRYHPDTLILETRHVTPEGVVSVTDLMPVDVAHRTIIRRVAGEAGAVEMELALKPCFDYGRRRPWQFHDGRKANAVVGPDLLTLHADVGLEEENDATIARFRVAAGESVCFALQYSLSPEHEPKPIDTRAAIDRTQRYWRDWIGRFGVACEWSEAIKRSLITLQALNHADTGGILGAPTLGLPEILHGSANWDYRYSWLRDSTFTLSAFLHAGFPDEAQVWRDWLLRAIAGDPADMRTMYRLDGAIHIEAREIPWLPGYDYSRPVRAGNRAAEQFQLDIYGEVLNSLYLVEQMGDGGRRWDMRLEDHIAAHLAEIWGRPDKGIWESRDEPKQYTYSKVMAWVGIDRFLKLADGRLGDPRKRELETLRGTIHAEICERAFIPSRNRFGAVYGSDALDAALLRLPLVGFLRPDDPRILGTIDAIEHELTEDGLVRRKPRQPDKPDEGVFLACTCWLADCLTMQGREAEARGYFERLLAVRNDVGLLSEEYDPRAARLTGNFPQTISHVALINTALRLNGIIPKRAPTDRAVGEHLSARD